ncbi:hypothetical protein SPRG_06515 [Saprolegnia parasitica CBS 223.65]|uniref:Uncharacterized protein n=1 Tax=Saprolegnia parasitica (strain CBS 223.65) TaxID=695850 RepID=A0A067CHK3_SAPPC|nr:hypothetical protein SPRG_06515 [Saprolegnia parasitica CBS 223.65]KDO28660.1 hypothetical protein SPRG_06515 [Saprolegnia parasitica CBS 223.65]|eukprot:XP_012200720.1 hypothetical protein SPRG_06515 [Saprolegnia parasitica CBS 223.65]
MATTFSSAVLGQPEIAWIVFEFQFGVYEDVRPAFRACKELIAFDTVHADYTCDATFPSAFAPDAVWDGRMRFFASSYALRTDERDDRLPLHLAVKEGFVQLTQRMLRCRPDLAYEDAILLAFFYDRLEIVELLLNERATVPELHRRFDTGSTPGDARRRISSIMRAFLPALLTRDDSKGIELLERFGQHPDACTQETLCSAISKATLDNLTLALNCFPWLYYPGLLDAIAGRGFLPLVQMLHERDFKCSARAMDTAASNGHLEVVRFLHFNRTEGCTTDALDGAIRYGHLDVVRFLIAHRTEGASPNILNYAAANGHLEIVQYLHSFGTFHCTVYAVHDAVCRGHLEVVQFLLTNRSEGCSRDRVVYYAVRSGHLRTAEYLLSLGYPFPTAEILFENAMMRQPEMVDVLQRLDALGGYWDVNETMLRACAANNVPLVAFLQDHSEMSCDPDVLLMSAVESAALDVVIFFLDQGTTNTSIDALDVALSVDNAEVDEPTMQH